MKRLIGKLVITIDIVLLAWAVASWFYVVCNNTVPYGELATWNMFAIIFG